jgi:hypothetical protein
MTTTCDRHSDRVAETCVGPVFRAPELPLNAVLRSAARGRDRETTVVAGYAEFGAFYADLAEVAVWTSGYGAWQEHATFLLRSVGGRWCGIGFSEPDAAELVRWLCELPGFDVGLLLELIGQHERCIVTLWRRPIAVGN